MLRILAIATLVATPALAQTQMTPAQAAQMTQNMPMSGQMSMTGPGGAPVSEPGQGAFATIAEIVQVLNADPETDWSKVNIAGLREHLRDMDVVMIDTKATAEDVAGGQKFTVTGAADVFPSAQRMAVAHAKTMEGVNDWHYAVNLISNGVEITVTVPSGDTAKLKGLGFYGMLAAGMHHQTHHWMMATGVNPHT